MLHRPLFIFSLACGVVLAFAAKDSMAKSRDRTIAVQSDFDLARQAAADGDGRRYRLGTGEEKTYPRDQLGPYWSYSPVSGGPKLEVAALGAGRKGAPKLAHVGVDWNF